MMIDIPEYKGLYKISLQGEVFSCDKYKGKNYLQKTPGKKMSVRHNSSGYLIVGLSKNSCKKTHLIHRIVASAYIPNPDHLSEVNHINGIKEDNRVENLEWCSRSQNEAHAYYIGLKKKGEMWGNSRPILQKNILGQIIDRFESLSEAPFDRRGITDCCTNKRTSYKGFIWEYD